MEFTNDRPIYLQIMEKFELLILQGTYKPGDKVPSVRELAYELSVNPNTVQRAFAELERQGLICSQRTTGRFITEDETMINEMRNCMAAVHIDKFLASMKALGFEPKDVIDMIRNESAKFEALGEDK